MVGRNHHNNPGNWLLRKVNVCDEAEIYVHWLIKRRAHHK